MASDAERDTGTTGSAALKAAKLDPRPMVDWLSPKELMRSGVRAVLAATFGNYADKREMEAALSPGLKEITHDYSGEPEIWFDFAADVGDGFNPTYALAWLLAQPSLNVREAQRPPGWMAYVAQGIQGKPPEPAAATCPLPAGRFLVLGGDQVYPTAMREEYRKRLVEPFEVAFRSAAGAGTAPAPHGPSARQLFALPGNHDWYDGLTSFIRLFCQQRPIGPLQTCQHRSYFALRLPHDWWLWAIDVQLEADLDEPQKRYFAEVIPKMTALAEGRQPRLILCTAEPTWVHCRIKPTESTEPVARDTLPARPGHHETLAYVEHLIRKNKIQLAVTLSGDMHHYAHYVPDDASEPHRITAGGGGAYLYPTHHLPAQLAVPVHQPDKMVPDPALKDVGYRLATVYPDPRTSRGLRRGVFRLPLRNRKFALFIGGLYLAFAWILQSTSKASNDPFNFLTPAEQMHLRQRLNAAPASLIDVLAVLGPIDAVRVSRAFGHVLRHSPSSTLFALLVVVALWKFRAADRQAGQCVGALHGVLHLLLAMLLFWGIAHLHLNVFGLAVDDVGQVALFTAETFFVGGALGGLLFATYLFLSGWWNGAHLNETFSSQAIEDFKNFLRLHIGRDGTLTIFPIAIPTVPRTGQWRLTGDRTVGPAAGEIRTELIGPRPIAIRPAPPPAPPPAEAPAEEEPTHEHRPTGAPTEARRVTP